MKYVFLIFLSGLFLLSTACTGGRSSISREGYCFNAENDAAYEPIPLKIKDSRYRKAVFSTKLSTAKINTDKVVTTSSLSSPSYEGNGLGKKIRAHKEEQAQKAKDLAIELAKIHILEEGDYEYVEAEIFSAKFLPQKVSRNKYRRIHIKHLKDSKGELVFANDCVSNMPTRTSIEPVSLDTITAFKVRNSTVLTDKLSTYTFEYDNLKVKASFSDANKGIPNSPKDFFEKPELNYQLYKINKPAGMKFTHELRSYTQADGVDFYVTVRYKFTSLKDLKAAAEKARKKEKARDAEKNNTTPKA